MLDSLEKKRQRVEELKNLIADPQVLKDNSLYARYAKELASLNPVINKYNEYLYCDEEIKKLTSLLGQKHESDFIELAKLEIDSLTAKKESLKSALEEMMLEDDPDADRNIIMEIRAGTGGVEASLFAADLFRMYSKFAQKNGWKVDVINTSVSDQGGLKEIIFSIEGTGIYRKLRYEMGVHRVQRVPETEASGRVHTSAATVAVLPEAEELDLNINTMDLKIDVFRAGGHGGQGVNKTESAVRITHLPTNTVVICQDERSQHKNKAKAMKVLRSRLYEKIKQDQHDIISKDRRSQIGTGDRSEKIRTYNFPDRRVTDHRIGLTLYDIENILEGGIDELIAGLVEADRKARLGKV